MARLRLATVLAVLAAVAVLAGATVALTAYVGREDAPAATPAPPAPELVHDPASGATFEVPADGSWTVRGPRVRIYYADGAGRPSAVVHGPAVYQQGYCRARPRGSSRAFAGFTRQDFTTWADALAAADRVAGGWSTTVQRARVRLADGTPARTWRVGLRLGRTGACAADAVEVAMVAAGGVRVVLVRDDLERGGLPAGDVASILASLRPGGGS